MQWLFNAETSHPTSSPPRRLGRFFESLYSALKNPSRAVLQFYPTSDDQIQLVTQAAQRAGFGGGIVVDYPNSKKARKVFLCLLVGGGTQVPRGLDGDEQEAEGAASRRVRFEGKRERLGGKDKNGKRKNIKDKDWVLKKKEVCSVVFLNHELLLNLSCSCIADEGKRVSQTIPSSLVEEGGQSSEMVL